MQDNLWFPASDTKESRIVGRFNEIEDTYRDKDQMQHTRIMTVLEHKVPGSGDVSASVVKPFNKAELIKRFPQAWAHFEKKKAATATEPEPIPTATEHGIKGTPIEVLDFLNKRDQAYLKTMGFLIAEQLRDLSDTDCNNIGFGSKSWRKKAAEHLASAATNAQ